MAQEELADFRRRPASAVVSLGHSCTTAYNLRRHFDFGGAFPFDWWITPSAGLGAVLRRPDPDWLYDRDLLDPTENGLSVRHRETGILLHHEFPRHWQEAGQPIRADFRDHVGRPKQRTAFLLAKLLRLNQPGERILFVRERSPGEETADGELLAKAFDRAAWALVELDLLSRPANAWRGDPEKWDAFLAGLGASFCRPPDAKPFTEVSPSALADND